MKKYFGKLLGGVLLFSLSMSLPSCDDILGEWTTVSNWAVAQKSDYEAIFQNLGSTKKNDDDGYTFDGNVNAYITTGVGGDAIDGNHWSATELDNAAWDFGSSYWNELSKSSNLFVRPVLGF